jgi:rRNA-processing protein FCF1
MRHGRAKQTRKSLQFYERSIANFPRPGQPYHVLLDGTFIVTAMKYNIPFYDRLVRLLGCPTPHSPPVPQKSKINNNRRANSSSIRGKANLFLYVCSSTIAELQALLERQEPATTDTQQSSTFVAIEKAIALCKSKHSNGYELKILEGRDTADVMDKDLTVVAAKKDATQENALSPAADDIWHYLTLSISSTTASSEVATTSGQQQHFKTVHYMIATQDPNLLYRCRSQRSPIPILRFGAPKSGCVLLLDPPSHKATSNATYNERVKWFHHNTNEPQSNESSSGLSSKVKDSNRTLPSNQRAVKKAKGPNPLSCKKKRTAESLKSSASTEQRNNEPKRKRRRKNNDGTANPATHEE